MTSDSFFQSARICQRPDGWRGGISPAHAGIYWVRFRIARPDAPTRFFPTAKDSWTPRLEGRPVNAVAAAMACSSELYWDGRLIWRNGVVGANRASEKVGAIDRDNRKDAERITHPQRLRVFAVGPLPEPRHHGGRLRRAATLLSRRLQWTGPAVIQ